MSKQKTTTITQARSNKRLKFKNIGGKRILNLEGTATAVGDIDKAIRELRRSKIESVLKNYPR